jgi:hypothetical protein
VESSCELGNEPSGSIKCWELPSGCTSCGLSSGTQLHRVSRRLALHSPNGCHYRHESSRNNRLFPIYMRNTRRAKKYYGIYRQQGDPISVLLCFHKKRMLSSTKNQLPTFYESHRIENEKKSADTHRQQGDLISLLT